MGERLAGRRIVLTGISRGVGFETAKLFLAEGADVLGVARDPERLVRAEEELARIGGNRLQTLALDLADDAAAAEIAKRAEERWGALDVLLNNAGVQLGSYPSFAEEPEGMLDTSLEINLLAPYRLSLAVLPLLRRGTEPRIVHVSSGAGTFAALNEPGIRSYRLSKWALNGLTMLQADELRGEIAVNAFDPGWVRTDLGGAQAPGTPDESARGALALVLEPFETTGKFFKDGAEIPW